MRRLVASPHGSLVVMGDCLGGRNDYRSGRLPNDMAAWSVVYINKYSDWLVFFVKAKLVQPAILIEVDPGAKYEQLFYHHACHKLYLFEQ